MYKKTGFGKRREGDWFLRLAGVQAATAAILLLFSFLVLRTGGEAAQALRERWQVCVENDHTVAELLQTVEDWVRDLLARDTP